jgi:hypothetical protein
MDYFTFLKKYGKYIEQNPDDWQDIIEYFKRENPTIKVDEGLKKEAKSNKYIRLYLQNIKRTNKSHEKLIDKPVKYADIIDEVLNGKSSMSYFRIRNLTPEEVNQIAERLLTETCDLNIEKMLDIFEFHKFPLKAELILNFAKQKRNAENKIVARAIYALKHLKSEGIREFALNKIRSSKNGIDYLHILISNYKKGDFNLLNKIANKTNNAHTIERLAGIYTDIYDANQTTECKEPLEILYSKMNCAIHRQALIEVLIKNKALSGRIREELKFDSYLETTQLIE